MPRRSRSSKRQHLPPLPTLHLELWVGLRKNRVRISRILRKTYSIARRITLDEGGSGPWTFLVDHDPPHPKTQRLRNIFGLRPEEDLWLELTYYPNKARMRNIIRRIWTRPDFNTYAHALDSLLSKRKTGYQATIGYGTLQNI